jgi:hypothetical protein
MGIMHGVHTRWSHFAPAPGYSFIEKEERPQRDQRPLSVQWNEDLFVAAVFGGLICYSRFLIC